MALELSEDVAEPLVSAIRGLSLPFVLQAVPTARSERITKAEPVPKLDSLQS